MYMYIDEVYVYMYMYGIILTPNYRHPKFHGSVESCIRKPVHQVYYKVRFGPSQLSCRSSLAGSCLSSLAGRAERSVSFFLRKVTALGVLCCFALLFV